MDIRKQEIPKMFYDLAMATVIVSFPVWFSVGASYLSDLVSDLVH